MVAPLLENNAIVAGTLLAPGDRLSYISATEDD
jgi:hypothetical protein